MGIWLPCIKMFRKHKEMRESVFEKSDCFLCEYSYSDIGLGAASKVFLPKSEIEVKMSYSVRDGILVQIKRKNPWRILFEYYDEVCLVNDEDDREYAYLVLLLKSLKKESSKCSLEEMQYKLEEIVYDFVVENFVEEKN